MKKCKHCKEVVKAFPHQCHKSKTVYHQDDAVNFHHENSLPQIVEEAVIETVVESIVSSFENSSADSGWGSLSGGGGDSGGAGSEGSW